MDDLKNLSSAEKTKILEKMQTQMMLSIAQEMASVILFSILD